MEAIDDSELPEEPSIIGKSSGGCKFKPIIPDEKGQMKENARKLSFEQRIVFDNIVSYCKDVVIAKKSSNFNPKIKLPQLLDSTQGGLLKIIQNHFSRQIGS